MDGSFQIVMDRVSGQREGRSVSFVVKLQVASRMPIAKRIVDTYYQNDRVAYLDGLLCHDASVPFT